MKNIIDNLKKLKEIQPDTEYSKRSKLLILATAAPKEERSAALRPMGSLLDLLKKLRQIQPDAAYSRLSKLAILGVPATAQRRPIFNWQVAFTMASLLLVLVSGSLIRNFSLKPSTPNLNAEALETEFNNMNIDIQLTRIDYSQKVDETVSLALKEITNKQTSHLNPIILESEQDKLDAEIQSNQDIDNLLDQVLL